MTNRPALRDLADRMGVLPSYKPMGGPPLCETTDETRVAILTAMGIPADNDSAVARSLEALDEESRARPIEPVGVSFEDERPRLRIRTDPGPPRTAHLEFEIVEEGGAVHEGSAQVRIGRRESWTGPPLPRLPWGTHRLRVAIHEPAGVREADQMLIVAPRRCFTVEECLGNARVFGLWTNLYTVRSERDLGFGNLSSLRGLVRFAAEVGADFVGINPLHALRNRGPEISPYSPVSRLFRNSLYLDVEAVPELGSSGEARALLESESYRREVSELRGADRLDYPRIAALHRRLLEILYRAFFGLHRGRSSERGRAYARFKERGGDLLLDFATFLALEEQLARTGVPRDWHAWPAELRNPRSERCREFRKTHAEAVEFWMFIQFEMNRQLERASREAQEAGLRIGLYQDLALGTAASGFDSWAFPRLFLDRVRLGAPPDNYAAEGQDWGIPPLDPRALAADRYRYWILLLRAAMAHSGAVRLDHVMGLVRQYWIPPGRRPTEGAYVQFPTRELLALLAIESRRHGALVIGEDLGTVPRGLPSRLARWGILSSRVLLFERDAQGVFRSASQYSPRALVTANTHDLPTLAGFWSGSDLELRCELGLTSETTLAEAKHLRDLERRALVRRLARARLLSSESPPHSFHQLCTAVNAFLCKTPAPLVGLSLDDLAGETEPVNVPGVPPERYPSWTRRMQLSLETLSKDAGLRGTLAGTAARARPVE